MRKAFTAIACLAAVMMTGTWCLAYTLSRFKWTGATTSFYVSIPGASGLWNTTFEDAAADWNALTVFHYTIFPDQYADPCLTSDSKNGVAFGSTLCGMAFGSTTLAVTRTFYSGTTATDTGIVFNSAISWTVYSDAVRNDVTDFRRVAVHELGHALGLGHESSVPSIMNPTIGNLITPQPDDINAVNFLYGATVTPDTTAPTLVITSHSPGQTVNTSSIQLAGTATDATRGDNGISSVIVNGIAATGGVVSGSLQASWTRDLTLNTGANTITVVAADDASSHNSTTRSFTINFASSPGPIPQTNVGDGRATNHVFAQLADGQFPDGTSYRSTFMISADNVAADCTWQFYGLTLPGLGTGSAVTVSLPAYDVSRLITPGTQAFKAGYATLSCTSAVTAQVLYSYIAPSGLVISEATVFSSPPATIAQIILDVKPGSFQGVALVNDASLAKTFTIFVSSALQTTVTLPAKSQTARFVNELIPALPATYFGTVRIFSNGTDPNDVYAIGLRYTGSAFATLPVTSITP